MNASRVVTLWLGCASVAACGRCADTPDASPTTPVQSAAVSPSSSAQRTTSPEIALRNLDSQIAGLEKELARYPLRIDYHGGLVGALLHRSRALGRPADLLRAAELGEQAVQLAPDDTRMLLVRSTTRAAMHRFGDALADLDAAERAKVNPGRTRGLRGSILAALGRYDEALRLLAEERQKNPDTTNLVMEAALLGSMGKIDEAEAGFVAADKTYRSVSPFFLAWVYFEHAHMWEEEGDLDKARALYRAALDRLPSHAGAALHLSAIVRPNEGIALLAPLLAGDDPEVMAQLGGLQNLVNKGAGDARIAEAKLRYQELLALAPLAYADHAAWFFLGPGADPQQAFVLAQRNLENRKTPEAFTLMLAAARTASKPAEACALAAEARALAYPTRGLKSELARLACSADAGAPP
jgi:tetratricopeptide (TPR) repeat protein